MREQFGTRTAKRGEPKKQSGFFVRVAFIAFVLFCLITVFQILTQIDSYQKEIASVQGQIASYQAQIDAMEMELSEPFDNAAIRQAARRKLNYSMPDDIIIYNDLSE
ncbi:MAG: septum formation initiator family protein [Clostridia bacterium]|nr:septum formation initiator family protein [Clostridia bacterium]